MLVVFDYFLYGRQLVRGKAVVCSDGNNRKQRKFGLVVISFHVNMRGLVTFIAVEV